MDDPAKPRKVPQVTTERTRYEFLPTDLGVCFTLIALLYAGSAVSVIQRLIFAFVCASGALSAQTSAWQPSPGHTQVPIWPGVGPDAQPVTGPETSTTREKDHLVAGKPWTYVEHVSQPTMTVYSPTGRNTGAAVVVFPGGGYWILAIDLEGAEVCDWLTAKGVTCVLLKYRVPGNGLEPRSGPYPKSYVWENWQFSNSVSINPSAR